MKTLEIMVHFSSTAFAEKSRKATGFVGTGRRRREATGLLPKHRLGRSAAQEGETSVRANNCEYNLFFATLLFYHQFRTVS